MATRLHEGSHQMVTFCIPCQLQVELQGQKCRSLLGELEAWVSDYALDRIQNEDYYSTGGAEIMGRVLDFLRTSR